MASVADRRSLPRSIAIRLDSQHEKEEGYNGSGDEPASACPSDQVETISRYGDLIELFTRFQAFHKLFDDDKLGQASNTTSIFAFL